MSDRLQLRVTYGDGNEVVVDVTSKAYVAVERRYDMPLHKVADSGSIEPLFYLAYISLKRRDSFDEFFDAVDDVEALEPDRPADPTGAPGH